MSIEGLEDSIIKAIKFAKGKRILENRIDRVYSGNWDRFWQFINLNKFNVFMDPHALVPTVVVCRID